jgi:hypothetical protein
LIEKAYAAETVPELKNQLELMRAAIMLGSSDKAKRLEAASQLAASKNPNTKTVLIERLGTEADADVKVACRRRWPRSRPRWNGATSWGRFSAASAWAASCCWWHWAWRSPTG